MSQVFKCLLEEIRLDHIQTQLGNIEIGNDLSKFIQLLFVHKTVSYHDSNVITMQIGYNRPEDIDSLKSHRDPKETLYQREKS